MIAKIVLIGLFFAQTVAAESTAYRFSRDLIRGDERQTLLAVTLEASVYAACADDFRDLRLVDQDAVETPYLLQRITRSKTVTRRQPSRSETPSLQKSGADGIAVTVSLDKDAANADGLTLVTKQHDFEYAIRVYGSSDGLNWQMLVDNAAIYDYSRFMEVGNRDIELPANDYRQFRIVVAQATQTRVAELLKLTRTLHGEEERQRLETLDLHHEPLHIERLDFWHKLTETVPEAETEFDYPVAGFRIREDTQHKISLIDLETRRQPLTGFVVKTDTPHFSRRAEVQIPLQSGIETRMQAIGHATLEALHFQDIARDQNIIRFPEQRQPHYRIVIQNQDNPPLAISTLSAIGNGYQIVFLPQPGKSYRLLYGNGKAKPAHYETAPILELLRRGYQSTEAGLGPEIAGAPTRDRPDLAELLNSKLFLGAAIALMVLVLAWSLYKIGKRVGDIDR